MERTLSFVAAYMGYLWQGARFRITDSDVTTSNGGDSTLVVESDVLRLRFVSDKTQVFLDFQPTSARRTEWYSVDLVRRLYRGEREYSAVLDEGYANFVEENLDDIEARFTSPRWEDETRAELKRLKQVRSKEMFG